MSDKTMVIYFFFMWGFLIGFMVAMTIARYANPFQF
jgi:hypothetical protein